MSDDNPLTGRMQEDIIFRSEQMNARAERLERMGIQLDPAFFVIMNLLNAEAAKVREELGLAETWEER